jgi:uncharacterized protein
MAWYLDSSAVVKLIAPEAETPALTAWIANTEPDSGLLVSDLVRTETLRAARRKGGAAVSRAQQVLARFSTVGVSRSAFNLAWSIGSSELRTLDALHLAVSIQLGDDMDGLVTYDDRLREAATQTGLAVVSPGR